MGNFDEYFPFDPGNGATANAARWRKMGWLWAPDGVVSNYLSGLSATLAAGNVTIQPGGCYLRGYYAEIQNAQTIPVLVSGTVVAKVDLNAQVCLIYYKDGAIDYNNYEQDTNVWEIPLWLVSGGNTLTDLRTMVSGGGSDLCWWGQNAGPVTVTSSSTVPTSIVTPRIPAIGVGILRGELLLTFSDASQAQSAICQLTYQFGQSDAQATPAITPTIGGGGAAGMAVSHPVSISGQIPLTKGLKAVAWRITAGTGAPIQATTMTAQLTMTARCPTA